MLFKVDEIHVLRHNKEQNLIIKSYNVVSLQN